jgi:spermidine/putrescine transport system substrate-binding protein
MKNRIILLVLVCLAAVGIGMSLRHRSTTTEGGAAKAAPLTLNIYAMSDYLPQPLIEKFEKSNGCKVRYDNFASNEELLSKLQAGATGYDLIIPSDYTVRALVSGKLIQEIKPELLTNLKNLRADFRDSPFDPGSKFTVPYTWGTTGLIYNTQHVKLGKGESWELLFDKSVSGHVALLDDEREVLGAMLKKLGFSQNSTDPAQLKQAQDLLLKLKPSVRLFSSDPKQHLLSGDIWVAQIYSGDANQVLKTNPEFKYFVPKEGAVIWIDVLAIPRSAKQVDLAHKFINMLLDAENAKELTESLYYGSPNQAADSLISVPSLRSDQLAKVKKGLEYLNDLGPQTEIWDRLWTEAKSH